MSDSSRKDRLFAFALVFFGLVGMAALAWWIPNRATENKEDAKVSQRASGSIKIAPKLAQLYGIKSVAAASQSWQPRLVTYGRVTPNAFAIVALRAPFAGTVRAAGKGWPEIGSSVSAGQELAVVQARFSPQERLDVLSKASEAQEKFKGADEVVKVQHDRVQRLSSISGIVPGPELDQAKVQLAEGKALLAGAHAQARLWQQVADNLDNQPIAVTLTAPLEGEIVDLSVRPQTAVEAGAVVLKVVDFRKVLIRLDVPLEITPPVQLEFAPPGLNTESKPKLVGRRSGTATVDAASQTAGYFYQAEAKGEANWRPGLFVEAELPDPKRPAVDAAVVPASAVLYHQGRSLVYVEISPGRFERREIQVLGRAGDMVYLSRGVRASELVVFEHPQAILSEEFRGDVDDD